MMVENKNFNLEKQTSDSQTLPQEEIYVMSDYLNNKKPKNAKPFSVTNQVGAKNKKSFPLWLIWILFGFIIISFAAVFYFYPNFVISLLGGNQSNNLNQTLQLENLSQRNIQGNLSGQPLLETSSVKILKAEIEENGKMIVSAEFSFPVGSISSNENLVLNTDSSPLDEGSRYKVLGGLFKLSSLPNLDKPASLKISYSEEIGKVSWEDDIKIGYWQDNLWIVLPTEVDTNKNILTTEISSLYGGVFGAIVAKEKSEPSLTDVQEIAPGVFLGPDQDNDSLTDKEEVVFNTLPNNPDTDNDSVSDGQEVINLYSPTGGYGTKLSDTDIVKIYSNGTFKYSLFYPASFLPKAMIDTDESEVIISTNSGEFFGILVEDNPDNLTSSQWYSRQISNPEQTLKKTKVDGLDAVWSLDGLNVYVARGDKIYILNYNIGGASIANFKSTFLMMIRSFKFLE